MIHPKFFLLLYLPVFLSTSLNAQSLHQAGARNNGFANATVALADEWSVFNNPGGIARQENPAIMLNAGRYYNIEGLDKLSAGFLMPFNKFNLGISTRRFGDHLYNSSIVSLSIGNQLGIASLGINANYHQILLEGYDTRQALSLDLGGIVDLAPAFKIGAIIHNINQSDLRKETGEKLPTILRTGFSYKPLEALTLLMEIEKMINHGPQFKTGIEYEIIEKFQIRGGFNTNPDIMYFGLGFKPEKYGVDYSLSNHPFLGFTHHLSLTVFIIKN